MPDEPNTTPQPPYEPPVQPRYASPVVPERQAPVVEPSVVPVDVPVPSLTVEVQSPADNDSVQNLTPPPAPLAPPPVPADSDHVWINKEEYLRLQQAEKAAASNVISSTPVAQPAKLFDKFQIATAALAGLALLGGLMLQATNSFGSFLIVPSLIVLALVGAFTINDKVQASKTGGYIKSHKGRNATLMTLAIVVVCLPILMPVGLVLLFMIMCAGGGCKGS